MEHYKKEAERFLKIIEFAKQQNLGAPFVATVMEKVEQGKKFDVAVKESLNEWDL